MPEIDEDEDFEAWPESPPEDSWPDDIPDEVDPSTLTDFQRGFYFGVEAVLAALLDGEQYFGPLRSEVETLVSVLSWKCDEY